MRVLVVVVNAAYFAVPMETVHQVLRHPLDTRVLTGTGALVTPPFAVLVSGEKDMLALAAEELPVAADFEGPVGPGTQPGELGVYSNGGRLVVVVDDEAVGENQLDLKRAS